MKKSTDLEVQVIDWKDGNRHVAILFRDFDHMITIDPESTRKLAFLLMQCADFIDPPFGEDSRPKLLPGDIEIDPTDTSESEAIFGPYEYDDEDDGEDDDEDDDEDDEEAGEEVS